MKIFDRNFNYLRQNRIEFNSQINRSAGKTGYSEYRVTFCIIVDSPLENS
jgi:hypothetical protein